MTRVILFIFLVFFDLIIKYLIKKNLFINQIVEITSFLDIVYIKNYGVSFGLFSGSISYLYLVFIGIIIVLFIFYLMINSNRNLEKSAYFIISVGATGNIIDRAINSYVVDYISLHYKYFYWPAFNLADIYITIGIIMLLSSIFLISKDK